MTEPVTKCPACNGALSYIMGGQDFRWVGTHIERISKDEDTVVCIDCRLSYPELAKAWKDRLLQQRLNVIKSMAVKRK